MMNMLAQADTPKNFEELILIFVRMINLLLPVLVATALLVFFWGLVKFLQKSGDAKSHAEGRSLMIWGVLALFVMISFMAIISFFYSDFGFTKEFGFQSVYLPTR